MSKSHSDCFPSITLNLPQQVTCQGTLTGTVTNNGFPVEGAEVTLTSSEPSDVSFDPNPAITDENGDYTSSMTIAPDTPSTAILVIASTEVDNILISATDFTVGSCPAIMETIYITNQFTDNFSAIDGETNTRITTEDTQSKPFRVAVTPDGQYAYITNLNSASVTVVRVSDNTVIDKVNVQGGSQNLVISPDGQFVYVYNIDAPSVSVIRVADNKLIENIPVEEGSRQNTFNNIDITTDGRFVYVTNTNASTVSVIKTSDNSVQTIIAPEFPVAVAAGEPNSEFVYVLSDDRIISVISTSTQSIVDTIDLEVETPSLLNLIITPDGKFLYVIGNAQFVDVVRTSDNTFVSSIELPNANFSTDLVASLSSEFVYVTANQSLEPFGTLNVIEVASNSLIAQVEVENSPQQVTVNSSGTRVYVSNSDPDSVDVIQTSDNTLIAKVAAGGNGGQGIAVTP
ncbi:YncE family protein [Chengkuizengella sediminis]|uniref:YncE family protein n=1 Tax=Chengkuizengella sediminis TaxID=1885917 RepID=UPI001389BBF3|nr:YncE family protein [Chengkuizengella sediminis]NDI33152.1 YncE family protein [Chengkuizengella sediminis]